MHLFFEFFTAQPGLIETAGAGAVQVSAIMGKVANDAYAFRAWSILQPVRSFTYSQDAHVLFDKGFVDKVYRGRNITGSDFKKPFVCCGKASFS